jgi:SAM-dependent methyltransferase
MARLAQPLRAARAWDDRLVHARQGDYGRRLASAVAGATSVLDVGCGRDGRLADLLTRGTHLVGVDLVPETPNGYDEYIQLDIRQLGMRFNDDEFDCAVALDVIEHLTKSAGMKLIADLERVARRRIVVFTPNGFLPQEPYDGNPHQAHVSGWSVEEMRGLGFAVVGINGWRPLRTERAAFRFWPRALCARLSFLTQPLVTHRPQHAFQLLCVRDLLRP